MARIVEVFNENERMRIIVYLSSKQYPRNLTTEQKKAFRKKCRNFEYSEGILKYKDDGLFKEIVIRSDSEKIKHIIKVKHELDHSGIRPTHARIKENYAGITIDDVKAILDLCEGCLREEPPIINRTIRPILTFRPRESIIIDTVDLRQYNRNNRGYNYIFTCVDAFSRYAWVYPSINKSADCFSIVYQQHIYKEGIWKILHTDNGGEFVNNRITEINSQFGIQHIRGRPYYPQSQGKVERFNRTLKKRLRATLLGNNNNWIDHLDRIVYYYNNNRHRATGIKPFILFKSYDNSMITLLNNVHDNHREAALSRMSLYVESYRREIASVSGQVIALNDYVLVLKKYNMRRGALDSLYLPGRHKVIMLDDYKVTVVNEAGEQLDTNVYNVKKI